jgi:hypothetical protein
VESFVVRIWTPDLPLAEERRTLRGTVEPIGSGRASAFGDERELLALLRGMREGEEQESGQASSTTTGGRP